MDIKIELTKTPRQKPDFDNLGFGRYFSDHMFIMEHNRTEGWHDARIVPYQSLSISPASTVLHYAVEIFEGMKAYRRPDGEIQLFRPMENMQRMNNSAERMTLPEIDGEFVLEALKKLILIDKDWVPTQPGASLYIRPFMFANDEFLGLHTVQNTTFVIITSPSGSYYKEGLNPVSIMIETKDVRAVRGGTGYAKCGGNYAASCRAGMRAEEKGYSQVLWLDGVERKYIEEVGAMNVMFLINDTVVTPALLGSVLPGITRKSIIELLKAKGVKVEERQLSVEELTEAARTGALKEAWGCGTAAVVSPIGKLSFGDKEYEVAGGKIGTLTQDLYDTLTGIQWGARPDAHGWIESI